jgi:hypothetical protein
MSEREPQTRPRNHRIDPADVQNPMLRRAFDLWTRLRAARRFPARSEINPRNMAEFLRNTVLVRVLDGGEEFQFRIVGDAIVMVQGEGLQGLTTAEVDARIPGYGQMIRHTYQRVCADRSPLAFSGWFENTPGGRAFFHESLILPLGADGETVDHILVVAAFAFSRQDVIR